jgi:hypothetical protein
LKKFLGLGILLAILFSIVVSAKGTPEYEIEPIVVHNPPELSLDIVFVPANFTWEEKEYFKGLVKNYTDFLFSVEPFATYKEVINTWMCFTTYNFTIMRSGRLLFIPSDSDEVLRLIKSMMQDIAELDIHPERKPYPERLKEMPNDQVVIVVKGEFGGSGTLDGPVVCSMTPGYDQINKYVFVHEFGHSFGKLEDEYPPNKDPDPEHPCIMGGDSLTNFCPLCRKKLTALLEKYSKPYNLTIFTSFPISYHVEIEIDSISRKTLRVENGTKTIVVGKEFNISIIDVYFEKFGRGERYIFKGWGDGVTTPTRKVRIVENTVLRAIFLRQYYVTVQSPYGKINGGGWYDEGRNATISLTPSEIKELFKIKRFKRWSGDIKSGELPLEIRVDAPKLIIAEWEEDWNWPNIYFITLVLALSSIAVLYYQSHQKNRRKKAGFFIFACHFKEL